MIRPVTLICWILALSAGLYLYRAKHEVELIDQHIDQIAKQTAELRAESRGLLDEWIRLGQPEQLHRYSDEYLGLQPISPTQFARLTDLAARLPATQPDPPEESANVIAQSSGADDQVGAASIGTAAPERDLDTASADDIPVPPIPPATAPVVASAPAAIALPLQARPVTPRPADGQAEPDMTKTRVAASPQAADDPHAGVGRMTAATPVEPRPAPAAPAGSQASGQPGGPPHGLPPLQAQGPRDIPESPPLQTQVSTREVVQGPGRGPAQGQGPGPGRAPGQLPASANGAVPGQPALRPAEPRTAENRPNGTPGETRPLPSPPMQHQAMEARGSAPQVIRQGQAQYDESPNVPGQGGSLLGMSRGSAPLPLPAPTPVNATWSGPAGAGSPGVGR